MTALLAGHDTTAAGLAWTSYLLAMNPDVQNRVHAVIDALGPGDRLPAVDDLPRLAYLDRVITRNPAAVSARNRHVHAAGDERRGVGGYQLRRGTLVQAISWITHRDPRWFPDPLKFDPDRWSPERASELYPVAWYPFGAGPRACVGQSFAMAEMVLIVATLLSRFRIEFAPGQGEPQLQVHMSLRPRGGIRVRFLNRSTAS